MAGEMPEWSRKLTLRPERVMALGGLDLPAEESARILGALGFAVDHADGRIEVHVPSWRADVEGEADLVEEVVRVAGYDSVPAVPLPPLTAVSERSEGHTYDLQ